MIPGFLNHLNSHLPLLIAHHLPLRPAQLQIRRNAHNFFSQSELILETLEFMDGQSALTTFLFRCHTGRNNGEILIKTVSK